jgi:hypothetical protein
MFARSGFADLFRALRERNPKGRLEAERHEMSSCEVLSQDFTEVIDAPPFGRGPV